MGETGLAGMRPARAQPGFTPAQPIRDSAAPAQLELVRIGLETWYAGQERPNLLYTGP
jgi:hypothetical protein